MPPINTASVTAAPAAETPSASAAWTCQSNSQDKAAAPPAATMQSNSLLSRVVGVAVASAVSETLREVDSIPSCMIQRL